MLEQIEIFLVVHKDFLTLIFTLVLILTSLVSSIIACLSVREVRRQCLFQEWVCLRGILHSSQLALAEFSSKAATAAPEQQGVAIDEAIANLLHTIDRTQKRITQIEDRLQMQQQGRK